MAQAYSRPREPPLRAWEGRGCVALGLGRGLLLDRQRRALLAGREAEVGERPGRAPELRDEDRPEVLDHRIDLGVPARRRARAVAEHRSPPG